MAANRNSYNSIRFRRWSRKGYAVFASLSKTVTIGVIQFSIGEQALKKTKHTYLYKHQGGLISDLSNTLEEELIDNYDFTNQNILKFNYAFIVSNGKIETCAKYLNINTKADFGII